MFDPTQFIPTRSLVAESTAYPEPYELAWRESHCGKTLSDAIETVRRELGVTYDMASSLIWAEFTSQVPRVPA